MLVGTQEVIGWNIIIDRWFYVWDFIIREFRFAFKYGVDTVFLEVTWRLFEEIKGGGIIIFGISERRALGSFKVSEELVVAEERLVLQGRLLGID